MRVMKGLRQFVNGFWAKGIANLRAVNADPSDTIVVVIKNILKVQAIDVLPLHVGRSS